MYAVLVALRMLSARLHVIFEVPWVFFLGYSLATSQGF